MELYTEQAESYEACIRKIEAAHGRSYKILNQKEIISRGFLGFGRRQLCEITYRVVGNGLSWAASSGISARAAVPPS